jgi:hypothetical protein
MWMEYSYPHGKYLAYVASIFFKKFVLLTKVQLTCLLLTTHKLIAPLTHSHSSYVVL